MVPETADCSPSLHTDPENSERKPTVPHTACHRQNRKSPFFGFSSNSSLPGTYSTITFCDPLEPFHPLASFVVCVFHPNRNFQTPWTKEEPQQLHDQKRTDRLNTDPPSAQRFHTRPHPDRFCVLLCSFHHPVLLSGVIPTTKKKASRINSEKLFF